VQGRCISAFVVGVANVRARGIGMRPGNHQFGDGRFIRFAECDSMFCVMGGESMSVA